MASETPDVGELMQAYDASSSPNYPPALMTILALEKCRAAIPILLARVAELEAETARQKAELGEWWRAAGSALADMLNGGKEPDPSGLYELYRGQGWSQQPPCALEIASNRIAELESLVQSLSERCGGQSELLATRATVKRCWKCGAEPNPEGN